MNQMELQRHVADGTLAQAAEQLQNDFTMAQSNHDAQKSAEAANDLGIVLWMQGDNAAAREYLNQAQQLFIQANDAAGQGRATGNLAQLEEREGNGDAASALYMQAADLLHEGGSFQDEYTTRKRLSKYYITRGATMMALRETVQALRVKPNANAWDKLQIWFFSIPLNLMGVKA